MVAEYLKMGLGYKIVIGFGSIVGFICLIIMAIQYVSENRNMIFFKLSKWSIQFMAMLKVFKESTYEECFNCPEWADLHLYKASMLSPRSGL